MILILCQADRLAEKAEACVFRYIGGWFSCQSLGWASGVLERAAVLEELMMDACPACCFVAPGDRVAQDNRSALHSCVGGKRSRLGYSSSYLRKKGLDCRSRGWF